MGEQEQALFAAGFLGALRDLTTASVSDPTSFVDEAFFPFAGWCSEQAVIELARTVRPDGEFFLRYDALATASADRAARRDSPDTFGDEPAQPTEGDWWHGSGGVALAALDLAAPQEDSLSRDVLDMVGCIGSAFQIWSDLRMLPRDLASGRTTYPIAVAAAAGGIRLRTAVAAYEVLGALVATDALRTVLDAASERLTRSREIADALDLLTFRSFIDDVTRTDGERRAALLGGSVVRHSGRQTTSFNVASTSRDQAVSMAERYLLSDTSFRESWETHREGMLGAAEVSSAFPAGLILEVLCRHGHDLGVQVDTFIAASEANRLRYYDTAAADTDADTVGVVLRLLRYASHPRDLAPDTERILTCVARLVEERGEPPVWLTRCDTDDSRRANNVRLGEGCGTVVAHLLLGLDELGDRYSGTVATAASHLFDRVASVGLGANVNYPPRYALLIWFRLLQRVPHERVQDVLVRELERLAKTTPSRAQEAALTVVCCRDAGRRELIDSRWISTILKQQRFDGSWPGEPFAVAPNRDWHVSPYSSTTLTTALCYDAIAGTMGLSPARA